MAFVYKLFSQDIIYIRYLNIVIGLLTCFFIFFIEKLKTLDLAGSKHYETTIDFFNTLYLACLGELRSKTKYHLAPQLDSIVNEIQKEVIFLSAYFVPGKEGVEFFKGLTDRMLEWQTAALLAKGIAGDAQAVDAFQVLDGHLAWRPQLGEHVRLGVEFNVTEARKYLPDEDKDFFD